MKNVRLAISTMKLAFGLPLVKFLIDIWRLFGLFFIVQLCQMANKNAELWDRVYVVKVQIRFPTLIDTLN